jgi:hypothetical protein|tara:strand:- start:685 stop:927 length:243 start_codon:yes stop_codon:yes gene_type:complete
MYRIVREVNHLTDRVQYFIERKKVFLWSTSWTTELGLDVDQRGPIGAPTYDGAKWKLDQIKLRNGVMIEKEVVVDLTNII